MKTIEVSDEFYSEVEDLAAIAGIKSIPKYIDGIVMLNENFFNQLQNLRRYLGDDKFDRIIRGEA